MERHRWFLIAALVVATGATVSSLFLSMGLGLTPCELCWYQRGLLFPQVLVLGAAVYLQSSRVAAVSVPLSLGGAGVAAYHSWIQLGSGTSATCTVGNPCSTVTMRIAGLTIPNLSLLTFAILLGLLVPGLLSWYRA
ncbi:MAG: disulfide bond formation protein B [Halanaeroarchaeum sp.]